MKGFAHLSKNECKLECVTMGCGFLAAYKSDILVGLHQRSRGMINASWLERDDVQAQAKFT